MSNKEIEKDDKLSSTEKPREVAPLDPLGDDTRRLLSQEIPHGVDRRTFLMRSAVVASAVVITGKPMSAQEKVARSSAPPPLSKDLNVVKKGQGPVLTTADEFYKVGPGPSSSHTIGPMRITYDFYQRAAKLPADKL